MAKTDKNEIQRVRDLAKCAVDEIYQEFHGYQWESREAYGRWLAQTYHFVKHATRLLTYAAARCEFSEEWLHRVCLKGANEERDHEALALNDLRHLGYSIEQFPEYPETAAYHQTLYWAIDHEGAAALVGYFIPLEGLAATKLGDDFRRASTAHSPRATSFLRVHCELDVDHFDDGLELLDNMTSEQLTIVERAIKRSVPLYRAAIARARTNDEYPLVAEAAAKRAA